MNTKFYFYLLLAVMVFNLNLENAMAGKTALMWNNATAAQAKSKGEQEFTVKKGRYLNLDLNEMKNTLSLAPMEFTPDAKTRPLILELPMPEGGFQQFAVVESPVMPAELAAKYPMIKTYAAQGLDNTSYYARLDVTQWGFHAFVIAGEDELFIDPINLQTTDTYLSYYKSDAIAKSPHVCEFDQQDEFNHNKISEVETDHQQTPSNANRSIAGTLKTYRLALACTGEYAAVFGTTVPPVFAAMVTSVNRVTGVYESELDIRLTLIANDDTLVYLNANTDPYTNNNGGTMLGENQTNITSRIGSANYDIGHVFSTGGGGIAGLGVVCQSSQKARGVTGLPTPVGDQFDIDFVAHEMGHQFGGTHTFNSVSGNCGGGNRHAASAFEPGSGITIMAYAGICAPDDDSTHSIAYFHTRSFDEIEDYITTGSGNSCPVSTSTGNSAPVSGLTVYSYNIPLNTPFVLTGAGSDPDGDPITYSFEEFENPPPANGSAWNSPSGNAPIFRSRNPTGTWRLFPKLSNILANINSIGELKPSYARVLHFRMTLRDNRLNGGGVTYDNTPIAVNVVGTGNPFAILTPNASGIIWQGLTQQTITWDVTNTTAAPISTPNVNIYMSVHGGKDYPFPVLIASNVPNNGSYTFTVPNTPTDSARFLVEGAGNIFFDINDKNVKITAASGINEILASENFNVYPVPSENQVSLQLAGSLRGEIEMNVTDVAGKIIYSEVFNKNSEEWNSSINIEHFESGIYFVNMITREGTISRKIARL